MRHRLPPVLGAVIAIMVAGFITGALARLAVPGPDPMPVWLTIAIGLAGSFGGGAIAYAAGARNAFAVNTAGFVAAVLLVVAYRRFVQKRPITGPDALRFPERGFGVDRYRDQLRRVGVDPDKASPLAASAAAAPATATPAAPAEE